GIFQVQPEEGFWIWILSSARMKSTYSHVSDRFIKFTSYRYLLLATERTLKVYSIKTSLLIRTFTVSRFETITTYALSRFNSDRVYIATSKKRIILADWTTGIEIRKYKIELRVFKMQVVNMENTDHDTIFCVGTKSQEPHSMQNCSISKV